LSKEVLEIVSKRLNLTNDLIKNRRYLGGSIHDGSLVESNKRGRLNILIPLMKGSSGYCVTLGSDHLTSPCGTQLYDQESSVLVDVVEFLQEPEGTLPVLPALKWLKQLDLCGHVLGKTAQSSSFLRVFERLRAIADGERIFFAGLILCGQNEFPHEVVKGRPEIA
jgi:hypothetical protein